MICIINRYIIHMTLGLVIGLQSPTAFGEDIVIKADLPDYVTWCTSLVISSETAKDEALQRAAFAAAITKMDKALVAMNVRTSSLPFSVTTEQIGVTDKEKNVAGPISMKACYIVDPLLAAPEEAALSVSKISKELVASLVCARASEGHCIDRLQSALSKLMPEIPLETIKHWNWRYTTTQEIPQGLAAITSALTAYDVRPVGGDAKIFTFGSLESPNPKTKRPLQTYPAGNVVIIPAEQGQWVVAAISLPSK